MTSTCQDCGAGKTSDMTHTKDLWLTLDAGMSTTCSNQNGGRCSTWQG
jgi:hypothetical protein